MPTLSLSMIVRDSEKWLAECLQSVQGVVNEIVIADTGSKDATLSIAGQFGARIIDFPWEDDYAEARNASLKAVQSDWVLVLDADERLDPSSPRTLPPLLASSTIQGYNVTLRNYFRGFVSRLWDRPTLPNRKSPPYARDYPVYADHENVRLFRRRPEIFFEGCVHESVLRALYRINAEPASSNLVIHHMGLSFDAEGLARKYLRYRELGIKKLKQMPNDAQAHLELALEESDHFSNEPAALALLERACELEPRMIEAWLFRARSLLRLGRNAEAVECARRVEDVGSKSSMSAEVLADAYFNLGNFTAARDAYRKALTRNPNNAELQSKLGLAEVQAGRGPAGLRQLREALALEPRSATVMDRTVSAFAVLGKLDEAAEVALKKLEVIGPSAEGYLRAASLYAKLNSWERVMELLTSGLEHFPDHPKLNRAAEETRRRLQVQPASPA
jgi:tetratricopeptide (TPR) repeat protein